MGGVMGRLEEIEERLSGQLARCIGGSFTAIRDARFDFAQKAEEDIIWLINRMKKLETALKIINAFQSRGPSQEIARKALESEE